MKKLILILLLSIFAYSNITPYFSKISGGYYKGGVDNIIIDDIYTASSKIEMAMYYLTNKNITLALIKAYKRGISEEFYNQYFNGRTKAYAIEIKKLREYKKAICPYQKYDNFYAPQSFKYIK